MLRILCSSVHYSLLILIPEYVCRIHLHADWCRLVQARTTELASVRNELELMKLELTDTQQCARVAASDCCMPASFVPNDPSEIRCVIEPLMRSVRK